MIKEFKNEKAVRISLHHWTTSLQVSRIYFSAQFIYKSITAVLRVPVRRTFFISLKDRNDDSFFKSSIPENYKEHFIELSLKHIHFYYCLRWERFIRVIFCSQFRQEFNNKLHRRRRTDSIWVVSTWINSRWKFKRNNKVKSDFRLFSQFIWRLYFESILHKYEINSKT